MIDIRQESVIDIRRIPQFLTADPYRASGGPANPGSWNRYSYAESDPVRWIDPDGLFVQPAPVPVPKPLAPPAPSPLPQLPPGRPEEDERENLKGEIELRRARRLEAAYQGAVAALLTPDCARVFTGGDAETPVPAVNPIAVLSNILYGVPVNGRNIGRLQVRNDTLVPYTLPTGSVGSDGLYGGANIILPETGPDSLDSTLTGARTLAETLLHELGHVFGLVRGLGGSRIVIDTKLDGSADMDAQIQNHRTLEDCRKAWGNYSFPD